MPGRRPIFATLLSSSYYWLRDGLFKVTLEPEAPEVRKSKASNKPQKKEESERKPW